MVIFLYRATLPLTSQLGSRNQSTLVSALTTPLLNKHIRPTTKRIHHLRVRTASFADIGITCGGVTLLPNPGTYRKEIPSRQGAVDMMARSGRGGRGRRGGRGGRSNRSDRVRISEPTRAGQSRSSVSPGDLVQVVQKQHQGSGQLTTGVVSRLLTNSGFHPRGIKVMLSGGIVGRVQFITGIDTEPSSSLLSDTTVAIAGGESHNSSSRRQERGYSSTGSSSTRSSGREEAGDEKQTKKEEWDMLSLPAATIGAAAGSTSTSTIRNERPQRVPPSPATTTSNSNYFAPPAAAENSGAAARATTTSSGTSTAPAAPATAPDLAAPAAVFQARQRRAFRAERVQGRSWSLNEDGELVAKGEGAEDVVRGGNNTRDEGFVLTGNGGGQRRGGRGSDRRRGRGRGRGQ